MLIIKSAFVSRVGKFRLVTVGSLVHRSPYVAIMLKDERIGWFSFTSDAVRPRPSGRGYKASA